MIIFDLDGTLANCEHRRHFVEKPHCYECGNNRAYAEMVGCFCYEIKFNPDWKSFYEACDKDDPIGPVIEMWNNYEVELAVGRAELEIWSGRCESVKNKTINWLENNLFCGRSNWEEVLKMRPIGDNTPDDQLKEKWLDEALAQGHKIDFVFDDRPKVIRMWRRRGIFVFNCCQHEEEF